MSRICASQRILLVLFRIWIRTRSALSVSISSFWRWIYIFYLLFFLLEQFDNVGWNWFWYWGSRFLSKYCEAPGFCEDFFGFVSVWRDWEWLWRFFPIFMSLILLSLEVKMVVRFCALVWLLVVSQSNEIATMFDRLLPLVLYRNLVCSISLYQDLVFTEVLCFWIEVRLLEWRCFFCRIEKCSSMVLCTSSDKWILTLRRFSRGSSYAFRTLGVFFLTHARIKLSVLYGISALGMTDVFPLSLISNEISLLISWYLRFVSIGILCIMFLYWEKFRELWNNVLTNLCVQSISPCRVLCLGSFSHYGTCWWSAARWEFVQTRTSILPSVLQYRSGSRMLL